MSKRCHYPIRSVFEGRSFQIDLERVPSKEIGTSLVHWLLNRRFTTWYISYQEYLYLVETRPGFRKTLAKSGMDTNFKNVIQRSSFSWRFYKSEHFFYPFAIGLDS